MVRHLTIGVLASGYLQFYVNCQDVPLPVRVSPSSKTYGPDGPWQAITVNFGTPPQKIDLYPGGIFTSTVFTNSICDGITAQPCASGGMYDPSASSTLDDQSIKYQYDADWTRGAMSQPGKGQTVMEHLVFNDRSELVANLSVNLISNLETIYPDGSRYPVQVGQLSLGKTINTYNFSLVLFTSDTGAFQDNQSFDSVPYSVNASLIPNYLQDKQFIPSSSYGLHIGSAALNLPLSLWLGGYDSSRAIGTVSSQPLNAGGIFISDLLDIGIDVDHGASPFSYTKRQGILAERNSSITTSIPVAMNPGAPYMYLPNSTCEAMVKDLPVTYNASLGLYFWNTQDPAYVKIITSPTYMSFSTSNLTIKVPFQLLNLTLDAPLVSKPTPYFPCQPPNNATDYSLGRAFLQAAFIGVNWARGNGNWFLAQAPGPNTAFTPVQKAITNTSLTIDGYLANWADTWKPVWTPLAASTNSSSSSSSQPHQGNTTTSNKSSLSGGAIAGVVIGAVVAVAFFVALGYLMWRRRMRQRESDTRTQSAWRSPSEKKQNPVELPQGEGAELAPGVADITPEADSTTLAQLSGEEGHLYELSGNERGARQSRG